MTATAVGVELLACPACTGRLSRGDDELGCVRCRRRFPTIAGIPDLRLGYADPYLSREEDVVRARELEARFDELDLTGLLEEHWRRSGKPAELAQRFVAGDVHTLERSRSYVAELERARGARLGSGDSFLELGCGTAGLAAVAATRAGTVVAADLSMRWLVLAKKALVERGLQNVALVCCGGEEPPFAEGSFDVVAASDVIEHTDRQEDFLAGCRRALRAGGILFLSTPNRFTLGLEPHVRLWGVGFLPRPLAMRYVRAARHVRYDHVRALSAVRLRRLLREGGFDARVEPPEIPAGSRELYRGLELWLVRLYNVLRRYRPARALLAVVGPLFHAFATSRGPEPGGTAAQA